MSQNNESPNQGPTGEDTHMSDAPVQQDVPQQQGSAQADNATTPQDATHDATSASSSQHGDASASGSPWAPDRQDAEASSIPVLAPGASPADVIEVLKRMIAEYDATLTDLAVGGNQERFQTMTQRRDELHERLETLQRINNARSSSATSTAITSQDVLVPRHLPAFQFYGSTRHAKNKPRFDSAQSFLEEFRTVLDGHSLDVERHWCRLMPMTVNFNSRAWLRELMAKESVTTWDTFCQEIIRQYSPPYTIFYRRYHLRTMRQKAGESLRQYSTKFQEYAVKTGIANNQELVFNYLCSLHRRYRKRSWSLVHNQYGEEIPGELEPIIQLVMTLASGERAPEEETLGASSDFSSDSESESDDSDSDVSRRKRRRQDIKKKGKATKKKGNCPIHRGSSHNEDQCQVLKKLVNGAIASQASSQASSSRSFTYPLLYSVIVYGYDI